MKTHYKDSKQATVDSPIFIADVRKLLEAFRDVLDNFDRQGPEAKGDGDQKFGNFLQTTL